jgi:N-acetylneuraminic acid mutarotase
VYGTTDVDLITGTETFPNVTQSETYTLANPDNPLQVLVAYNDSRGRNATPINISGASYSTDGGNTYTRLTAPSGQSPFPGTEGDPVVLYSRPTGTWFTVWLDTACGGQGLGGFKSTTPGDPSPASWTHFCIFNESQADRESGWSDNNPSSPFYGHMYVSWNDFNVGGGALQVRVSTDNGLTWTQHSITSSFIRDVQITGDLATGVVYIAGMNEGGGGFPHNDSNLIYRSTDGGATWANTYTGPIFPGPGVGAVGYFAVMFTDGGGYWRHEGWGEPAAFNGVVSLVYAQHGAGTDPGDVYYIRSTDMGVTFSAPLKLNTDTTTRPQWQPNLSVSPAGTLLATWYDARESTSCTRGAPGVPCYRMWSRKSNDNGVTWLPDDMFSDVVSPLPAQPDTGIVAIYVGDYDYGSAILTKHLSSWADGRVAIGGQSQQDAFTDREAIGCTPGWSAGGNLPSAGVRLVGVDFPANGKFYAMGGRASDSAGSEFTHPFEYDPVANTWTTKSATYPDTHVNNMACGVLTDAGTPYIYCVGGSQVTVVGTFDRVFRYNPVTDVLSPVAAPWPGAMGMVLPGGFTVLNNKLYILGGFDTVTNGGQGTNQIWEFTPSPAAWVQKPSVLLVPLGYIPTTTIGSLIYTGGGSDITAGALTDTTNSFVYNPVANTIGTIAPIPRATGETRALNFNGKMLVMGGGRTAPNPSNEVDAYDPASNMWTVNSPVPAFMTARRNFPTDTNGIDHIWLAGGYASDNVTPLNSTEVFCAGAAPMASDAFSRKVHGGAGTFDIPLPLTGNVGVECRIGPTYQMIIDFPTSVTVGSASVTSGTGMVSSFSGSGTTQITVNLSGVTDVQRLTMTLHGVNNGNTTGEVPVSMGVLVGDVNGNASVNASDVALTKSQVGQAVGGSNFREDVNVNGTISATDVALVKSDVGHSLPP